MSAKPPILPKPSAADPQSAEPAADHRTVVLKAANKLRERLAGLKPSHYQFINKEHEAAVQAVENILLGRRKPNDDNDMALQELKIKLDPQCGSTFPLIEELQKALVEHDIALASAHALPARVQAPIPHVAAAAVLSPALAAAPVLAAPVKSTEVLEIPAALRKVNVGTYWKNFGGNLNNLILEIIEIPDVDLFTGHIKDFMKFVKEKSSDNPEYWVQLRKQIENLKKIPALRPKVEKFENGNIDVINVEILKNHLKEMEIYISSADVKMQSEKQAALSILRELIRSALDYPAEVFYRQAAEHMPLFKKIFSKTVVLIYLEMELYRIQISVNLATINDKSKILVSKLSQLQNDLGLFAKVWGHNEAAIRAELRNGIAAVERISLGKSEHEENDIKALNILKSYIELNDFDSNTYEMILDLYNKMTLKLAHDLYNKIYEMIPQSPADFHPQLIMGLNFCKNVLIQSRLAPNEIKELAELRMALLKINPTGRTAKMISNLQMALGIETKPYLPSKVDAVSSAAPAAMARGAAQPPVPPLPKGGSKPPY